jgi:hypothetical protein
MSHETLNTETPQATDSTTPGSVLTPEEREALRHDGNPWANKFKNPYELEKAYGESVKVYNENKQLKQKIEEFQKAPDEYVMPDDLSLAEEDVKELSRIAKESDLSQAHFEKVAKKMSDNAIKAREAWENRKKDIGEEKLNLINDYVQRANFPEKFQDIIINKIIEDNDAMSEAFKHRDKLLNSQVPGMNQGTGMPDKPNDGQKELRDLIIESEKRNSPDLKDKIIKLAREIGHERYKDKINQR